MKLRDTILSLHAEVLQAKLQNADWFPVFHRMSGHVADCQYLLPSKESLQLCADFLSTLPSDSTPVKLFGKRVEHYLSRYSFFFREAQTALVAVEHVAGLAAAANLFGVSGRHTMPWQETREAIAEASAVLDSYIDGEPTGVEIFASMLDRIFDLALACTNDPQSNFDVGVEKTDEILRLRDALPITVLLEEL